MSPRTRAEDLFTRDEIDRASAYQRPAYRALAASSALTFLVLAAMAFSSLGDRAFAPSAAFPWWAQALCFSALVVVASELVTLPVSFWRGYVHERRWGFSTQSIGAWAVDRTKGLSVAVMLTSLLMLGFVWLARTMPTSWVWVAAPAAAVVVLLLSFVAPVILEPIFNRFAPLDDERLSAEIRELADRAGVPVRAVLVADASRRTRKENAYVSGLGPTRRVVLFDTLLRVANGREIAMVAAHELGHRRLRHVALLTVLGMAGAVVAVVFVWRALGWSGLLSVAGASGAGDPRVIPLVLLLLALLEVAGLAPQAWLSRRLEAAADESALEATRDPTGFETSFRGLAQRNLLDLDPPRVAYALLFSHPTPPERIAAARRWAAEIGGLGSRPDGV